MLILYNSKNGILSARVKKVDRYIEADPNPAPAYLSRLMLAGVEGRILLEEEKT